MQFGTICHKNKKKTLKAKKQKQKPVSLKIGQKDNYNHNLKKNYLKEWEKDNYKILNICLKWCSTWDKKKPNKTFQA